MEGISSFGSVLFEEAMVDFVLSPLPVAFSLEDASFTRQLDQNEEQASGTNVDTTENTHEDAEDFAKKELRRLKDRIRRRRTNLRRKTERQDLLNQIDELSKRIEELKRTAKYNKMTPSASAWKATASRQRKVLQSLVDDRRVLRNQVAKRVSIIQDLRCLLQDQLASSKQHGATAKSQFDSQSTSVKQSDSVLFQQFIRELDTVYRRTGEAFKKSALDSNALQASMIQTTRQKEGSTEYFQSYGKQMMPFEYHQTCHYLLQLVVLAHRQQERQHCEVSEDPANTIAVKFRIPIAGHTASMHVSYALRRYFEENRTVLVWRALDEGEGIFKGMHSDETGWCVIYPSPVDSCTTVETCNRLLPIYFGTTAVHQDVADRFTEMVLKSSREDIAQISMKLDKLLVDEALGHIDINIEACTSEPPVL